MDESDMIETVAIGLYRTDSANGRTPSDLRDLARYALRLAKGAAGHARKGSSVASALRLAVGDLRVRMES